MPWRTIRTDKRRQRGDTIVEVLICVAIVSMILGGAYVTSRRSSQAIRNSQEHSEALKLVQAQLEQVKSSAAQDQPEVFTTTDDTFCMVEGRPVSTEGQEGPKCRQNASGLPATEQPIYEITVTREMVGTSAKFAVKAEWDSITGIKAQETIFYRLQP